jgi:antirestriction protein ArdC
VLASRIPRTREATRRYYTGINVLILWSARDEHGYPSPQWKFKRAIDKGGYVS